MIANLSDFFVPTYDFYLNGISYKRIDDNSSSVGRSLTCTDNLSVGLSNDGVKVILERVLTFDPESIFQLSVSFGANLKFNEKKEEIDWSNYNLAEEFQANGDFVLNNLYSRSTLLIGNITSSFGQQPIIIPSDITKVNE